MHKTANVLNKLPKSQQPKAKRSLQEIWMTETRTEAVVAFDAFIEIYRLKYEKAADCLAKDREVLLAFYDFPAPELGHEPERPSDAARSRASARLRPFPGRSHSKAAFADAAASTANF